MIEIIKILFIGNSQSLTREIKLSHEFIAIDIEYESKSS